MGWSGNTRNSAPSPKGTQPKVKRRWHTSQYNSATASYCTLPDQTASWTKGKTDLRIIFKWSIFNESSYFPIPGNNRFGFVFLTNGLAPSPLSWCYPSGDLPSNTGLAPGSVPMGVTCSSRLNGYLGVGQMGWNKPTSSCMYRTSQPGPARLTHWKKSPPVKLPVNLLVMPECGPSSPWHEMTQGECQRRWLTGVCPQEIHFLNQTTKPTTKAMKAKDNHEL